MLETPDVSTDTARHQEAIRRMASLRRFIDPLVIIEGVDEPDDNTPPAHEIISDNTVQ
jgi:hypothetical protein